MIAHNGSFNQVIRTISIENFRCYRSLQIERVSPFNVIVGQNGSGKTALLEAIFLALGRSPELGARFRAYRGMEFVPAGTPRQLTETLWKSLFYNKDWDQSIYVVLGGDGPPKRSVQIFRTKSPQSLELSTEGIQPLSGPLTFIWTDFEGVERTITPTITARGSINIETTNEYDTDFFMFPSAMYTPSSENASRFSNLRKEGKEINVVKAFTKQYPWITDLSIEVDNNTPVIYATIKHGNLRRPLADVSGGMNRIVAILVAIANAKNSVVLVDEIENGLYYSNMSSIAKMLFSVADDHDCQLIFTTHSDAWLHAIVGSGFKKKLSLWRTERQNGSYKVRPFSGDEIAIGLEHGSEIR